MHLSIHIDGNEGDEKLRRIANAVLALGGLLPQQAWQNQVFGRAAPRNEADFATDVGRNGQVVGESPSRTATWVEEDEPNEIHEDLPAAAYTAPPVPSAAEVKPLVTGTDANGLPWDERIHSGSRAVNADGTWRYRKNVPAETKLAVEAELRTLMIGVPAEVLADDVERLELTAEDLAKLRDPAPPVPPAFADTATAVASAIAPPLPPPVPTGLTRSYSDVVNIIMSRKITPEMFVPILGSDLPTFAATCRTDALAATAAFDALDHASRA
jgi:hypothetical protein